MFHLLRIKLNSSSFVTDKKFRRAASIRAILRFDRAGILQCYIAGAKGVLPDHNGSRESG